jgi:lipopolysaccharide transport system ATP-binding protein
MVSLENVSTIFRHRRQRTLLRDHIRNVVQKKPTDGFYALHDVSFKVRPGESLGVVGANGAGKSTLLSLIAGLVPPDRGKVHVNGRVGALLDLGSGFHPDLTGRENLLLNAALLGLRRSDASERSQSIIEFSELAEFIDEPLRTYSSGMVLRLGFAVAIHAQVDILLIDEILAVGDLAFQAKCLSRVASMRRAGTTLICVSHVPEILKEFCDRLAWLHHGQLIREGPFDELSASYLAFMSDPNRHLEDSLPKTPRRVGEE